SSSSGRARGEALGGWLDANLPAEAAAALKNVSVSAEVLSALELLAKGNRDPSVTGGMGGGMNIDPLYKTEADLRAAQNDPRYWDPLKRDPAFVRGLQEGWKRIPRGS